MENLTVISGAGEMIDLLLPEPEKVRQTVRAIHETLEGEPALRPRRIAELLRSFFPARCCASPETLSFEDVLTLAEALAYISREDRVIHEQYEKLRLPEGSPCEQYGKLRLPEGSFYEQSGERIVKNGISESFCGGSISPEMPLMGDIPQDCDISVNGETPRKCEAPKSSIPPRKCEAPSNDDIPQGRDISVNGETPRNGELPSKDDILQGRDISVNGETPRNSEQPGSSITLRNGDILQGRDIQKYGETLRTSVESACLSDEIIALSFSYKWTLEYALSLAPEVQRRCLEIAGVRRQDKNPPPEKMESVSAAEIVRAVQRGKEALRRFREK